MMHMGKMRVFLKVLDDNAFKGCQFRMAAAAIEDILLELVDNFFILWALPNGCHRAQRGAFCVRAKH